ncbi:Protein dachsous [Nymphon striatum]|nr:Protein dachsous [Nymphon striatum]
MISATDPDCGVNAMVNYTIGARSIHSRNFDIQAVTGDLCIAGPLDHEHRSSYEIPVLATDRGGLSTTALIKIQVIDVNDNRPIFYPREYNVSLRENTLPTTPVVGLVATDADSGLFGRVSYFIVSGDGDGLFKIGAESGEIYLTRSLNQRRVVHNLTISARDGGGLAAELNAVVSVSVIDSRQRPPSFEHNRYTFTVSEDVFVDTVIGNVKASGYGSNGVRYSIHSGDPNGYFTIDPMTATITTNSKLDHESHPFILLNVQAQSGQPPSYGHAQVNITVWDVNDNAPQFDSMFIKTSVPENSELDVPIYVAEAFDADSGANGKVHYSLGRFEHDTFKIDKTGGQLTLKKPLDYETLQRYKLNITAYDNGVPPLGNNISISIEVQDVNDNPPVFDKTRYLVNVLESLPANSQILQVSATDKDTGNNARLTYKLFFDKKTDKDRAKFGIFPNSGSIYLKQTLDREEQGRYELKVVATDNGSPIQSSTSSVIIKVLDTNDNDPHFAKRLYEFTVEENLSRGSHVGTMEATDKDLGNNASLRYSLIQNNSSFQINPITGEIFTKRSLDREKKTVHEFTVHVKDQGTVPRHDKVTVRVLVTDTNDNSPMIIEPVESVINVREEEHAGVEVVQVKAVDEDEGNNATITYGFIKGDESVDSVDSFDINPRTGMITTRVILDHEARSQYTLTVSAQDNGNVPRGSTKTLHIEVVDLNDNRPTFPRSNLNFKISESIGVGETVGLVKAIDRDGGENGRVTYTILSGNLGGVFDIDKMTGRLFTSRMVDYEIASEYLLQINAIDSNAINPQSNIINIKVSIEDVNDNAPTFLLDPILFSVSENTKVGAQVWQLNASDPDGGKNGQVTYTLVEQSPVKAFKVDSSNGSVILTEPLDYEVYPEYTLVMMATDMAESESEKLSTSVTTKVIIEDANDNAPKFVSSSRLIIMENEPVGDEILHVIAVDRDSRDNGRVTYKITSGNDEGKFDLDYDTGKSESIVCLLRSRLVEEKLTWMEGNSRFNRRNRVRGRRKPDRVLTIAESLDREVTQKYVLNITANDHGKNPLSTSQILHIAIEDVNDNPPKFDQKTYVVNVSEDIPPDSFVTRVRATDKDAGTNLTYIIPTGIAQDRFVVDQKSGVIKTARRLDKLPTPSGGKYKVIVYAHDGSFPARNDSATIIVNLKDINNHVPNFHGSCYPLHVPENSELSVIHTVVAMDDDVGLNGQVTYSITAGNIDNRFSIDVRTGELSSLPLDRERVPRYNLGITARDRGRPPKQKLCNITVYVIDQNDNDPEFIRNRYTTTIPEDVPTNTTVLVVKATDPDSSENSEITYSLSNETQWLFTINNRTGVIRTTGKFDREKKSFYHFEVRATDGGRYNARSARANILISISDVNDNKPVFTKYPFTAQISENSAPGTNLLQVEAFDKDEGINSEIVFGFVNSPPRNKFFINPDTGIITTSSSLRSDYGQVFFLEVLAKDRGTPSQSSVGLVKLVIGTTAKSLIQVQENFRLDFETDNKITLAVMARTNGLDPLYGFSSVVSATDDDNGQNGEIIYHIIDGNHDNAFLIDPPFSGIVKTNIVLDREIRDSYMLTIIATDSGTPQMTGTCSLSISIVDVNDNQPIFPPHSVISVSEEADVGTVVTMVTANDVDTNPALTYRFASDGNPDKMFSIDAFSGKIMLAQPLDHEKKKTYELKIESSDAAHVAETKVTVNVVDVNDNAPAFLLPSYQVFVPERTVSGKSITRVQASDKDTGDNAKVFYSLVKSPTSGFRINPKSGIIYTNKSVIYNPKTPVLELIVQGFRFGQSLSFHQLWQTHVSEDAVKGSTILKVSTTDVDPREYNYNLYYSFIKGNNDKVFHIKSRTGQIMLVKDLDREKQNVYSLEVAATDKTSQKRSSSAIVTIIVDDVNDHAPTFNQTKYEASVSELAAVGHIVLRLTATDSDSEQNAKIVYDITSGNDIGHFLIDRNTGYVTLNKSLDYDEVSEYRFIVRATDSQSKTPKSVIATVHIKVLDENDNAPHFPVLTYLEFASENSPIGTSVFMAHANDGDRGIYGDLNYTITKGEDHSVFVIDSKTGLVSTNALFDYEEKNRYYFAIMCSDLGGKFASVQVQVDIQGVDEYNPKFTEESYQFTVPGDADVGYIVSRVQATDEDKGIDGRVIYQFRNAHPNFKLNKTSGVITVKQPFKKKREDRSKRETKDITLIVTASSGRPNSRSNMAVVQITVDYSLAVKYAPGANTIPPVGSNSLSDEETKEASSGGLAGWALGLVISLAILAILLVVIIVFLRMRHKKNSKKPVMGDSQDFDNSFDTLDIRPPPTTPASIGQYPPRYNDIAHYEPSESSHRVNGTTSEVSDQSHSASSGRGSAEEGEDVEDEEIRMINEGPLMQQQKLQHLGMPPDSGIQPDDDNLSDISIRNTQEYLARLGINTSHSDVVSKVGSVTDLANSTASVESMHMFDDEGGGADNDEVDINNLIYAKVNDINSDGTGSIIDGNRSFGFADENQPSMTGSLSSIVHSEEELTGSYNWDYLLDWGPQYQPLAHVFAEIACLKDDDEPDHYKPHKKYLSKNVPPPLITNVAPRSVAPVAALTSPRTSQIMNMPALPRSPISHENNFTASAMSPSFSPSLSPLATRTPSMSPLVTSANLPSAGNVTPHHTSRALRSGIVNGSGAASSTGSNNEMRM